jgi:hypothetical protein
MGIYETGGHGEPSKLIVECQAILCKHNGKVGYGVLGCRIGKDIYITILGKCSHYEENRGSNKE